METIIIALISGLAIGLVVGSLGAGGGVLTLPALVYLLGQDPHSAAIGSLIIVILTCLVALPSRAKRGQISYKPGITFGAFMSIGSILGGLSAGQISGNLLLLLFGTLVLVMSGVMVRNGNHTRKLELKALTQSGNVNLAEADQPAKSLLVVALIAIITGFLTTGLFGVGGGFMVVPMLVIALGLGMRKATGTAQLVLIIGSLFGLVARIGMNLTVDWVVITAFAITSMIGGALGGPLSQKAKPSTLNYLFAALLLAVAAITITDQLLLSHH